MVFFSSSLRCSYALLVNKFKLKNDCGPPDMMGGSIFCDPAENIGNIFEGLYLTVLGPLAEITKIFRKDSENLKDKLLLLIPRIISHIGLGIVISLRSIYDFLIVEMQSLAMMTFFGPYGILMFIVHILLVALSPIIPLFCFGSSSNTKEYLNSSFKI